MWKFVAIIAALIIMLLGLWVFDLLSIFDMRVHLPEGAH
jgi:hypothetical protein